MHIYIKQCLFYITTLIPKSSGLQDVFKPYVVVAPEINILNKQL